VAELSEVDYDVVDAVTEVVGDPRTAHKVLGAIGNQGCLVLQVRDVEDELMRALAEAITASMNVDPLSSTMTLDVSQVLDKLASLAIFVGKRPPLRQEWLSMAQGGILAHHPSDRCVGMHCCLHNPSNHVLREAPLHWYDATNTMFRICDHSQPHPDPDHLAFVEIVYGPDAAEREAHHDCDGCCRPEEES